MTLWQVRELSDYWIKHPPTHALLAAFVGFGASASAPASLPASDSVPEAPAQPFNPAAVPGLVMGDVFADLPPPIFDIEELMKQRLN